MRLDRLTPAHVRRAIALYLEQAYPSDSESRPAVTLEDFEEASTIEELLARFELPQEGASPSLARYTLRLGNWRYPFMKFVVQEYLVHEEYFFSVDTHDDLKITPDMPDYEGWREIRRFNRGLKQVIEAVWNRAGLPTNEDLRELMEGLAQLEKESAKKARLLVVDDEEDVAMGLEAVLEARGYEVEVAFDGRQVLDRLELDPVPDLVLLDYSMPVFDGEEVMQRIRGNPRCQHVPILLATATSIDLSTLQRASGLLRKPYPREVLFAMIRQLLGGDDAPAEGES